MSTISTHVLDIARGRPAAGVSVRLSVARQEGLVEIASATTDADGRIAKWEIRQEGLDEGIYQLVFDTASYFRSIQCSEFFYPEVTIVFQVKEPRQHYHVPLLLSPYGYSTYRGS